MKRRSLIIGCLVFSIAIHLVGLFIVYQNPLWVRTLSLSFLRNPSRSIKEIAVKEEQPLNEIEKKRVLEETLNHLQAALPKQRESKGEFSLNSGKMADLKSPPVTPSSYLGQSEELAKPDLLSLVTSASSEYFEEEDLDIVEMPLSEIEIGRAREENHLSEFFFSLSPTEVDEEGEIFFNKEGFSSSTPAQERSDALKSTPRRLYPLEIAKEEIEEVQERTTVPMEKEENAPFILSNSLDTFEEEWDRGNVLEKASLAGLDAYALSEVPAEVDWVEDVDVDVSLMPNEKGGYVFSLTLNANLQSPGREMGQNFYFIIDRTSSIEKQRFALYKRAVERALSALEEGDFFNIIIFDKRISRLSEEDLAYSSKTARQAQDYLEKSEYKEGFAAGDFYTSLDKIIPKASTSGNLNAVILLSDGNTLISPKEQKKALSRWLEKNQGKVFIYPVTAGKDNDLVLLDLVAASTGGKLLYSDTQASFARKVVKLVKDLHNPLAIDIAVEAFADDPTVDVKLYPSAFPFPNIYSNRSYVITGTIDQLSNFTLFLQGRNGEHRLNIKKEIVFDEAAKGGLSLKKEWSVKRANVCYETYLEKGKKGLLKEAKEIVRPYGGDIARE